MPRQSGRKARAVAPRRAGSPPVDLVLYVSQNSRHTPVAQRNCLALLARFDQRRVRVEVCDVSAHPERAEEDAVLFTPMLVKRLPLPRSYVLGDLSNTAPIIDLLESCGVRPTR
jgi:two-component system response regulator GlrR